LIFLCIKAKKQAAFSISFEKGGLFF